MRLSYFLLLFPVLWGCKPKEPNEADVIYHHARFYTVDSLLPQASVMAVAEGRILEMGDERLLAKWKGKNTRLVDLGGAFAMPGFIEGHGHFAGLGNELMNLNFRYAENWNEIVGMVAQKAKTTNPGDWIIGRGWHQEKWTERPVPQVLGYPFHHSLSEISPENPVMLRHASGHSLYANAKAMQLAGVTAETPNPPGGEIVRDSRGEPIGVFEERAMDIITAAYKRYEDSLGIEGRKSIWKTGIKLATQDCLSKGITSFQDAGANFEELAWYEEMAKNKELQVRLWVMVRQPYDSLRKYLNPYPKVDVGNGYFTCRAIKSAVDGALGAYGAWLLQAYNDKPGFMGQNTVPIDEVERIASLAKDQGMQLCVHAIGDRANQEVLNIMENRFSSLKKGGASLRWRMEHAQHLDTTDIPRFARLGVIASMQGIHCTSDAPFVVKRLGADRARYGAYAWRSLLDAGVLIANGTDTPVEDSDPLPSLYASVTRKRADSGLVFFNEQAMTRAEALYSYTMANAYAAFEEKQKGSLSPGKWADFIVLSKDLSQCTDEEILQTNVLKTVVGGTILFQKK